MEQQPIQKQNQSLESSSEQESSIGGITKSAPAFQLTASDAPIQRVEQESHYGKFKDVKYDPVDEKGVDIDIEFEANDNVDATKIAFVQVVKNSLDGDAIHADPSLKDRQVNDGSDADGYRLDRLSTKNNPVYGAPSLGAGKGLEDNSGSNSKYKLGHHYDNAGTPEHKNAFMHDKPKGNKNNNSKKEFETTALAIDGAQKGTYYGSVTWGYEVDGSGNYTKMPFSLESEGTPSNKFMATAEAWNDTTARGTVETKNDDTISYKKVSGTYVEDFKVAKGTKVKRKSSFIKPEGAYQKSEILTGPKTGSEGIFKVTDLLDKGDGKATVNLPIEDVHKVVTEVKLNEGIPGPIRHTGTLKVGDRVKILDKQFLQGPWNPDYAKTDKVEVEVVQGDETGAKGWIPATTIQDENENVG